MKSFALEEMVDVLKSMLDIDQKIRGLDYLKAFAENITETFQNKFILIGHMIGPLSEKVQTDLIWDGSSCLKNFTYKLAETPCEKVLKEIQVCVYPSNVTQQFPNDSLLIDMGIESYVGSPVLTSDGKLTGIIVLLDDKPVEDIAFYKTIIEFLAIRIGNELERHHLEELVAERTHEIKNAYQALKDSEAKFRSLSDAAFEGVVIADEGTILEVNEAMGKMFGYELQEIIGMNVIDLVEPDLRAKVTNKILTYYQRPYETTCLKKNGTQFPVEVHCKMFSYKDRQVMVVAIRDVTERKQVEKKKETLISELEKALGEIKTLRGILPICSFCKKIRDDQGYWEQVDVYIKKHSHADISHSFCPECAKQHYPEFIEGTQNFGYEIQPDQNLILSHCTGIFSFEDIIQCCDKIYSDPSFRTGMNDIMDLSHTYLTIDYGQLKHLAEYIKSLEKDRGKCRIAVVTNGDLVFGVINTLGILTEGSIIDVAPFKSHKAAKMWATAG